MRVENATILTAGDMSQATLTSTVVDLAHIGMLAIQAVYTGAPVGSLKFQGSVDGVSFSDLSTPAAVAISAAGSSIVNIADIGYTKIQCVYTKTSGTGALTIKMYGKGF